MFASKADLPPAQRSRQRLRDASGKAVKLSDLDVAAFKGLTLDKAPFGRMT